MAQSPNTTLLALAMLTAWIALCADWTAKDQPGLAAQIKNAQKLEVEDLCVPVESVRKGNLMWVPNPDGKTYDLLQWYFKGYGGPTHVFIMDLGTGELKQDGIPMYRQIHIAGRTIAPDGKLYLATPDRKKRAGMDVFVYDPATNTLSGMGIVAPRLGGEKRSMCVGMDGKVYGSGSYSPESRVGAYQIDPATGKVTEYGAIGPSHAPHGCWADGIAADEKYLYLVSGRVPYYLVAFDKATRKEQVLLTTERVGGAIRIVPRRNGNWAYGMKVVGTDGKRVNYWLHNGQAIPKAEAKHWPGPNRTAPSRWVAYPPRPEVSLAKAVPKSDGLAEIWRRTRQAKAAAQEVAADAPPEQRGWLAFRFTVPTYPLPIYRLTELPDGRVFGTSGSYEGSFIYDPKTDACDHMGKIYLSHYTTAIHNGKVYMSGYWAGPLYVYDPAKPWTAQTGTPGGRVIKETDNDSNPRMVCRFRDACGTVKNYAAAVGADRKVYFGGRWYRSGDGGGFSWWDPKTEKAGGMWREFSNYQINSITSASDGKYIVVSTLPVRDVTLHKPTPKQGKLFVYDTSQGKIVREIEPFENSVGTGFIVGVGRDRVLGMTAAPAGEKASVIYGLHAESGEVAFVKKIPFPMDVRIGSNQREPWDYRLGPHGHVWTYVNRVLVRIDPKDASIQVIGKPARGGRLAFSGSDVYLSASEHLRRIKGAARNWVPRPSAD